MTLNEFISNRLNDYEFIILSQTFIFVILGFLPVFFYDNFQQYTLLYFLQQHIFYFSHRLSHQILKSDKHLFCILHHLNKKHVVVKDIIEPLSILFYAAIDQIIPSIIFGSKYKYAILYLTLIDHFIGHAMHHMAPSNTVLYKIHNYHHKYPEDYLYTLGNPLLDHIYGTALDENIIKQIEISSRSKEVKK